MQHLRVVHIFTLEDMRLCESSDRFVQIFTVLDVNHHRQEGLLHIFYLGPLLQPSDLVADSPTDSLIDCTVTHLLFNVVHQGRKKLVDVLLHHRSYRFTIDFGCLNKVIGVNWGPDTTI